MAGRTNMREKATQKIRKAIRLSLNDIGRRAVADLKQSVEVRVQFVGNEIIRSEPGEPPRRQYPRMRGDRQELYKSIKYKTEALAETIEDLRIYTTDPKAPMLEYGTEIMEPRPFFGPFLRRVGGGKGLQKILRRQVKERLKD